MRFLHRIRRILIDGLVVLLPIALTGYLLWLGYTLIDRYLGKNTIIGTQLSRSLQQLFGIEWIPGLSVIYTFLVMLFLGFLTQVYFGRIVKGYLDRLFNSLPLVKKIYTPAKEIVEAILGRESFSSFKQAVLFEYPRKGIYTIGFITNRFDSRVAVYMFTAPDPFTGQLMLLPREDVTPLDVKVEDALRLVISMGISTPEALQTNSGENNN